MHTSLNLRPTLNLGLMWHKLTTSSPEATTFPKQCTHPKSNTSRDQTKPSPCPEVSESGVAGSQRRLRHRIHPLVWSVLLQRASSRLRPASLDLSPFCSAWRAAAPDTPWSPPRAEAHGRYSTHPNSTPSSSAERGEGGNNSLRMLKNSHPIKQFLKSVQDFSTLQKYYEGKKKFF